ncbi:MAG TPA: universal stress protein [Thermodesulfovibrionales bacterium]|nr:universal stress protein [Thermodesulfovibrionales bacterium]
MDNGEEAIPGYSVKIERILAGIDLGPDTGKILAYASLFAKITGASLQLLSVLDYLVTPPAYLAPYIEDEKKIAEEKFRRWEERLAAYGVSAVKEIRVGRLAESFAAAAEKGKADMLVLGFKTHTFRRSSSEGLVKGLRMPVLVVRGERAESADIGPLGIRKTLCPTDFSETSSNAFRTAKALAGLFSSELTALHVVPSHIIEERLERKSHGDRAREDLLERAKERLAGFLKNFGLEDSGVVREGDPYREISAFASEEKADLIVIGARGLSSLEGPLIGSVCDAVLKSSPCPVLVIH